MIRQTFPSIGSRLAFFATVILIGYFLTLMSGIAIYNQVHQAGEQRLRLSQQEHYLLDFRQSVFASMILIDRIILEDQRSAIPELLALNEDSLGYFGRYQSAAQLRGLEHDSYSADEYESLVYRIRSDFFEIASLYQDGEVQAARTQRLVLIERTLPVLITFIENARELRQFDLADISKRISELRQIAGASLVAILVAILLFVTIIVVAINRSIVVPIETLKLRVEHFTATGQTTDPLISSAYDAKDEVAHLSESFIDMADQLLENEARQRDLIEELQHKNAELERFTYTVSHDLKSPLVTVAGFIGLLEKDIAAGDKSRVNDDIQRIIAATDTMAVMLEDLLELSRVGRQVRPSEEISLTELSAAVVERLEVSIKEHMAQVKIQADMPTVVADKLRIGEVIQNLLENAIKFSGEGSQPRIEISATREQNHVLVRFKDNGIGIDPRYHDAVFGLFDRLDSSVPGTGIGLALVKRIVEIHGGNVWIESSGDGRGSTFCFTLQGSNDIGG